MKTHNKLIAIVVAAILLVSSASVASAVPPLPSSFYGAVKVDGVNVPPGTVVSAWINGVKYAQMTALMDAGNTVYALDVPGDDASTPGVIEGGKPGDTIVFHVGDLVAEQTATWQSGVNVNRSLTATSANHSPTISNIADQTTAEDTTLGPVAFTVDDLETPPGLLTLTADSSNTALVPLANIAFGGGGKNRTVTIAPAPNQNGLTTITITVGDADGGTALDSFALTVSPVNDPPNAVNDTATTAEDTPIAISVLANDADPDNDAFSVASVTLPSHGVATTNDTTVTYIPAPNYNGPDSFSYTISDGHGGTDDATVNVTVTPANDAPDVVNDSYTTNEDAALIIAASGVLGNDTDIDGDALTAALVGGPSHGTLTLNANGSFTYTPAANYNGADSFTYRANDGAANSNTATVSITVNPVNDAPVAVNDTYTTNQNVALTIPAPGALGNDTDVDGNALTAVLVNGPSHGALTLNANGSFTYTPASNYSGADSFTYRANDGAANSNVATAAITVMPSSDVTPPVTTASVTGTLKCAPDIYSTAAVTLAPNEPGNTRYRLKPFGGVFGSWQNYTAPFTVTGEGANTVEFHSTDLAGNVEATKTLTVKISTFPATSVLDNFNRRNGSLGSKWSGDAESDDYRIVNKQVDVGGGGPLYWSGSSYGTDQQAFVTLATVDSKGREQDLLLKVQGGSKPDWRKGVIEVLYDARAKAVRVETYRPGQSAWKIYANNFVTFQNGDRLGARVRANGEVWIYRNCELIAKVTLSASDQAFFNSKGGRIGLWFIDASKAYFDDFGGGSMP